MRIDKEWLLLSDTQLIRFSDTKVFLIGSITWQVTIGTYPWQPTKEITFFVIDYSSAYNAIIGRPTLNAWKAATSTYHLLIKFPMKYGMGKACEDGNLQVLHSHARNK